jgi:hypothetical protein
MGTLRGVGAGDEFLAAEPSPRLLEALHTAVFAISDNDIYPALAVLARAPREAARSKHMLALIRLLVGEIVCRVGESEYVNAEELASELELLPSTAISEFGDVRIVSREVGSICEHMFLAELARGIEPSRTSLTALAVCAWRERTSALLSAHVQARGFKGFRAALGPTFSRDLATWVRKTHRGCTRQASESLRTELLCAEAFVPVLEYLATPRPPLTSASAHHIRALLYTQIRHQLGHNIPYPPTPRG